MAGSKRQILRGVSHGDKTYGPGDEDAFAAAYGKPVDHLVSRGVLAGDWGGAESGGTSEPAPSASPPAARKSARKSGAKKGKK